MGTFAALVPPSGNTFAALASMSGHTFACDVEYTCRVTQQVRRRMCQRMAQSPQRRSHLPQMDVISVRRIAALYSVTEVIFVRRVAALYADGLSQPPARHCSLSQL